MMPLVSFTGFPSPDSALRDQFGDALFAVTFTYQIAGEASEEPMNPQVEMLPNLDVHLKVRPCNHWKPIR